jgi:hypothetical protein
MYFHHRKQLFYSAMIVLTFMGLVHLFMGVSVEQFFFILALLSGVTLFGLGYYWRLEENVIIKYICFREVCRIEILQIQTIEAIKIKEFDKVHFEIGKGPFEDKYRFILKDGSTFTSLPQCRNNQGITIGRYLHNTYKIKLIEKEKIKYFNT